MHPQTFIGFKAIGVKSNGEKYDCSFYISFPNGSVNNNQINHIINQEIGKFKEYHPTGKILEQKQKVMIVS